MVSGTCTKLQIGNVCIMNPHTCPPANQKWCHVVCTMYSRRELLKIPATARFCEREINSAKALSGWTVAAVSVTPTRVRVLVRIPSGVKRRQVLRAIKRVSAAAMRRAGAAPRWCEPDWGERFWCSVIRSARALAAVHRSITARDTKSVMLLPQTSDIPVQISVGEEPSRGVRDVLYLGQDEVLKSRSVR